MGAEIRASRTLLGGNSLTSNQDWTGRYKTESLADFLMKRFIGLSVEGKGRVALRSFISNCKSSTNFAIHSQGRVLGHSNKKKESQIVRQIGI